MNQAHATWAIVLAAGEGTRLRSLTVGDDGQHVPKQYCSLSGERTLLGDTIARVGELGFAPTRVVTVVAAHHRRFWRRESRLLGPAAPAGNLVVQPANRGTAPGLLLPLLTILERAPDARVVVFPSDHHVERLAPLRLALDRAQRVVEPGTITLLGIAPDADDADYGWIVPEPGCPIARRVERFVEKPDRAVAERLARDGALWNSFLMVGRAQDLVDAIAERLPWLTELFRRTFALPWRSRGTALESVYDTLDGYDFSKHVLQEVVDRLRVVEVEPCGWTDLGTADRIHACIRRFGRFAPSMPRAIGVDLHGAAVRLAASGGSRA